MTRVTQANELIDLGRVGEHLVREVVIPLEGIASGAGHALLLHQRSGDAIPYPVAALEQSGSLVWPVTNVDTGMFGYGQAEVRWIGDDGRIAKSQVYRTFTQQALSDPGEVPEAYEGYVQAVERNAKDALNAAAESRALYRKVQEDLADGKLVGAPGFSPIITVFEEDRLHRLHITDATGTRIVDIHDGADGGNADYVTPESFGAVGDGVTDDTEAIQKAIDSGYAIKGDPLATYCIKGEITHGVGQRGTVNGSFLVEDCCFYTPPSETSKKCLFLFMNPRQITFRNCRFRTDATIPAPEGSGYVKAGYPISNVVFLSEQCYDVDAGLCSTDILMEACDFENGYHDLFLRNFNPVRDDLLNGSCVLRNCVFRNSVLPIESKAFKNSTFEGCSFIQSDSADRLSHCIYPAAYYPYSNVVVRNTEFYATSDYPIHCYHSYGYNLTIENCIIHCNKDVSCVIYNGGTQSTTKCIGCIIDAPDSALIRHEVNDASSVATFVNCSMDILLTVNISSHEHDVYNSFVGCDIAFRKEGFLGGQTEAVGCLIKIHEYRLANNCLVHSKNTRIENCHIISYSERKNTNLFAFLRDCDVSNCLIESRANIPRHLMSAEGLDVYLNNCTFKGFMAPTVDEIPLINQENCRYVDCYALYPFEFEHPRSGTTTAAMGGRQIPSGEKLRVKSQVETTVSELEEGYRFSHWNDGFCSNPYGLEVRENVHLIPYVRYACENLISDQDMVPFEIASNKTLISVNAGAGSYKLVGRNVVKGMVPDRLNPTSLTNAYGTVFDSLDVGGTITVTQTHHEIDPENEIDVLHYFNGILNVLYDMPRYGGIAISFRVKVLSNPLDNAVFIFCTKNKYGAAKWFYETAQEDGRVSCVIPREYLQDESVEIRIGGMSLEICDIQVEYADAVHDYEPLYNGGEATIASDGIMESFLPKLGYNQIIQTDGASGLITVSMEEGPDVTGAVFAAWDDGAAGEATAKFSENGAYYMTGKNFVRSLSTRSNVEALTNGYGTTISQMDPDGNITVEQSAYPNTSEIAHYTNGMIYFMLPFAPKSGKVTLSFDADVTQNPLNSESAVFYGGSGSNILGTLQNSRFSVTVDAERIYSSDRDRYYIEFRLAGRSMVISNVQAEYGEEATSYELPFIGECITVTDAPETVTIAQRDGYNAIMQTAGEAEGVISVWYS